MEEKRGISSEPASISKLSGDKRKGDGLEPRDELGSKRAKVRDLDSDTKSCNMQPDTNTGIAQQQKLSSEQMSVTPAAEGLGRVVREKDVLTKDVKSSSSISKDNNRLVANSGKQALPDKDVLAKDESQRGGQVDAVSKNSSLVKPRDVSESVVVSPRDPVSEKAGPFQMSGAETSLEKSDSMRRWMEMKRNGFLSGPLGGVSAPSSAATTTPVEVPAQKQQKNKRRSDSLKKKNEAPSRKEQQQVDRFSNVTAPSGLLTELNPGIINHVRSKKQVCSIIEALIRNATDGERNADLNVRDSIREDKALAFKLPSSGASDHVNSFTTPEQATSLAVQAATVASQWLDFLHQDLSGRLAAVQDSRNRVHNILTAELPLLVSSKESSSTTVSGDVTSDKSVTETHHIKWSAKFNQIKKALCDEEKDLERSLNQVKEMQSRCNEGLRQMDEYSPFSSQSSDSSFGKDGSNLDTSMAVQAAAASIFSTCSFLLSMMKPPATSS
ncbi:unnamed protein product [Eruca vesicaria subsp. sativa]|uniref:Uncharacterized protein n=1 Tax=Eruca vesicaria subsp. sativa TaxID=29727 RepID=A0ABC8JN05_ERUVS|nr:unnamed protein product [Eruca vesicaria subsp. sativa]